MVSSWQLESTMVYKAYDLDSTKINRTHRWGWWRIQTLSFLDLGVVPSRCTGFQRPAFLEIQIEIQKQIHIPLSFTLLSWHVAYFPYSSFSVYQKQKSSKSTKKYQMIYIAHLPGCRHCASVPPLQRLIWEEPFVKIVAKSVTMSNDANCHSGQFARFV